MSFLSLAPFFPDPGAPPKRTGRSCPFWTRHWLKRRTPPAPKLRSWGADRSYLPKSHRFGPEDPRRLLAPPDPSAHNKLRSCSTSPHGAQSLIEHPAAPPELPRNVLSLFLFQVEGHPFHLSLFFFYKRKCCIRKTKCLLLRCVQATSSLILSICPALSYFTVHSPGITDRPFEGCQIVWDLCLLVMQ